MTDGPVTDSFVDFEQRVDAIEGGYEFLLAYAAQGRHTDRGAAPERNVRTYLQRMQTALDGLGAVAKDCAKQRDATLLESCAAFFAAVDSDADKAQGAVRLILAQEDISSQLVDNLNASIHLRALLTDIFIIDEAFKRRTGGTQ
jgi:hypothetical protein